MKEVESTQIHRLFIFHKLENRDWSVLDGREIAVLIVVMTMMPVEKIHVESVVEDFLEAPADQDVDD